MSTILFGFRFWGLEVQIGTEAIFLFPVFFFTGYYFLSHWDKRLKEAQLLILALIGSVGIFGSVFIHELGHAAGAKALGIRVDGILINLFRSYTAPEVSPYEYGYLRAAAVFFAGPMASLLLACVSAVFVLIFANCLKNLILLVTFYNLSLGVSSLLPIPQLDGGLILRCLVESIFGQKSSVFIEFAISAVFLWLVLYFLYTKFQKIRKSQSEN